MAGNSVKNKGKYEALKREGMSEGKAARIAQRRKVRQPEGRP